MKNNFNIQTLIRTNVAKMQSYSSARDEYNDPNDTTIFLDANENPFDTGLNRYPDPNQTALKKVLSKLKGVPPENILLGNGSDEVLDLIFRAFCEPNRDSVITLPPTYGMYNVLANLNAVQVLEVPLSADFKPKVDEILAAILNTTKIIFLCSPNNPSGNVFSEKKVERLLMQFHGLVVIDEAYIDFSDNFSWLKFLDEFPNLIITQTFSKAYGMAGIRLGVCYGSTEIISVLKKIKPPYNVNQLTQKKALKRLKNRDKVEKEIKAIQQSRTLLLAELEKITYVKRVFPSQANFFLLKVDDATTRYKQLLTKGIIVRNRTKQKGCENMLRVTVGTAQENKELIKQMKSLQL
ncbi:histidinol-phosphate transaminase [Rasiella sp. SM2506]|uniref:histidinol-phosphate transaminase n=1 Tax=Rasiella sp. SM2506 TaxID=3423914 RepID=UPI003D7AD9D8